MSAQERKPLKHLPKSSTRKTEQERQALARGEDERERKRRSEAARDVEAERRRTGGNATRGGQSSRGGRGGEASSSSGNRAFRGYARGGRGGFMGQPSGRGGNARTSRDDKGSVSAIENAPNPSTTTQGQSSGASAPAATGRTTRSSAANASLSTTGGRRVKQESELYQGGSISLEPSVRRVNVEEIDLITPEGSDHEDVMEIDGEEDKRKMSNKLSRAPGFLPVRIRRRDHIERVIGINTEASSSAAAEIRKKWQEDGAEHEVDELLKSTLAISADSSAHQVNSVDETKQWQDEEVISDADQEANPETRIELKQESTGSPGKRRKSAVSPNEKPKRGSSSPVARRLSKSRGSDSRRGKKSGLPTGFDDRDWQVEQDDRVVLRQELGQPSYRTQDEEPSTSLDEQRLDPKSNNIYLFQFPPVMPDLTDMAKTVKKEEPHSPNITRSQGHTDREKDVPDMDLASVKIDDDIDGDFTVESTGDDKRTEAQDQDTDKRRPKLAAGKAGKMLVYESGRITLSWGGVTFEVRRGMDRSFLQTAILTSEEKHKDDTTSVQYDGNAISLGQVRGKFIVIPDTEHVTP